MSAIDMMRKEGASYADCRFVEIRDESINVRNKVAEGITLSSNKGIGIRAIVNGAWGFAASNVLTGDEVMRVARRAIDVAKASALTKTEDVVLSEEEPYVDK
jgi:TldD protein